MSSFLADVKGIGLRLSLLLRSVLSGLSKFVFIVLCIVWNFFYVHRQFQLGCKPPLTHFRVLRREVFDEIPIIKKIHIVRRNRRSWLPLRQVVLVSSRKVMILELYFAKLLFLQTLPNLMIHNRGWMYYGRTAANQTMEYGFCNHGYFSVYLQIKEGAAKLQLKAREFR